MLMHPVEFRGGNSTANSIPTSKRPFFRGQILRQLPSLPLNKVVLARIQAQSHRLFGS